MQADKPLEPAHRVRDYFRQLALAPDSTVIYAAAGLLEESLGTLLHARLRRSIVTDQILHGPLATLTDRAHLGFAMGLIDEAMHRNILKVDAIRTAAGPQMAGAGFADHEVAEACMQLDYLLNLPRSDTDGGGRYTEDELRERGPRKRFAFTVILMVERLLRRSEALRPEATQPPGAGPEAERVEEMRADATPFVDIPDTMPVPLR